MNILVVDDSAMMRGIIKQVLQDNHTSTDVVISDAEDGEVAWRTLNDRSFQLVILDWNMPVLDGLGFVKRVRGHGMSIPIVMISAVTDEDRIYEAGQAGVTTYIEKPIRGAELWDAIREYFQ